MPIKRARKSSVIDDTSSIAMDDTSNIAMDDMIKDNLVTEKAKSPVKSGKKVKRKLPVRMARFRKPHSIRKYHDASGVIPVIDLSDSEDIISSQGTLNFPIPHPADFEGLNNPYLNNYKSNLVTNTTSSDPCSVSPKSAVQSTIKRGLISRLCCRKNTRKNTSAPKEHSAVSRSVSTIWKNNTRLRSHVRPQKKSTTVKTDSVISTLLSNKSIPASSPSSIDMDSSLSSYFGAAERFSNGKKFTVLAKRISPNGTEQYLVEWDTSS